MFSSSVGTRADSITLDLEVENDRTLLEFGAAEDRAFSVGSSPHADVRVRRRGVPPIAFYLERRGDAVWLVPAYRRSSLRVDAAFVIAPCRLGRSAQIEFSRVQARAALRTDNAAADVADVADVEVDDAPTALRESTRRSRLAYLASLPDVHDRTEVSASQPALEIASPSSSRDSSSRDSSNRDSSNRDSEASAFTPRSRSGPRFTRREESRAVPAKLPTSPIPPTPPIPAKPPKPPVPPHLWVCLEQRPFEAALLILAIGLVILAAALAAACFLR